MLTARHNANKKKQKVKLNQKCEESFQKSKELCSSMPIMAHADYSKPFKLHSNVCELCLGVVLYQKQTDGTDRVIAYASDTLSKFERNYTAHKL